jgi:hypothetical protein
MTGLVRDHGLWVLAVLEGETSDFFGGTIASFFVRQLVAKFENIKRCSLKTSNQNIFISLAWSG